VGLFPHRYLLDHLGSNCYLIEINFKRSYQQKLADRLALEINSTVTGNADSSKNGMS